MAERVVFLDRAQRSCVVVGRLADGRALVELVLQGRNGPVPQNAIRRCDAHELKARGLTLDDIKRLVAAAPAVTLTEHPKPQAALFAAAAKHAGRLAAHYRQQDD
jgi:hypothetical protein